MEIDKKVTQGMSVIRTASRNVDIPFAEGYVGMALVGTAAALGAILVAGLIRKATRNS